MGITCSHKCLMLVLWTLFRWVAHTAAFSEFWTTHLSLLSQISSGAPSTLSQSPPPAEPCGSVRSIASVDRLNESFHQEAKLKTTTASKSDTNTEKDLSQSKTIVNDSCLMELFKKCQTCGQTITKKRVSHCGAQKKVRWSCLGGHRGIWMSSPHLWEAFPEIHLLTALAILFSGGTFTYFKKWAQHLHLNFMGNKTFFDIQKAYLNSEKKQLLRTEQDGICVKGVHQQLEVTPFHASGDGCFVSSGFITNILNSFSFRSWSYQIVLI